MVHAELSLISSETVLWTIGLKAAESRPSLVEYLKSHALRHPEEYGREKSISLSTLSGSL